MSSYKEPVSTIAFCWRIERRDGAGLALTSHDAAVERDGIVHRSDPGVLPAAVTRGLGLEAHSSEVSGALSAAALTDEDLRHGRWDGARIRLSAVDWESPGTDPVEMLAGELGEVAVAGGSFAADLLGASSRLNGSVCPSTSPQCRAEFGDKMCRFDLSGLARRAAVVSGAAGELRVDQSFDQSFLFGRLRYLSGANCGSSTVILAVDGSTVRVRDLPRAPVESGCIVELRQGCDKRFETCSTRFGNAANFRGEPHLPGNDLLTRYPGA